MGQSDCTFSRVDSYCFFHGMAYEMSRTKHNICTGTETDSNDQMKPSVYEIGSMKTALSVKNYSFGERPEL